MFSVIINSQIGQFELFNLYRLKTLFFTLKKGLVQFPLIPTEFFASHELFGRISPKKEQKFSHNKENP
jgi:hypothetical protein